MKRFFDFATCLHYQLKCYSISLLSYQCILLVYFTPVLNKIRLLSTENASYINGVSFFIFWQRKKSVSMPTFSCWPDIQHFIRFFIPHQLCSVLTNSCCSVLVELFLLSSFTYLIPGYSTVTPVLVQVVIIFTVIALHVTCSVIVIYMCFMWTCGPCFLLKWKCLVFVVCAIL